MKNTRHFKTSSTEETKALGAALGRRLSAGDVVAMTGDLGAGKTHFTMGAAAALGVSEPVVSPTFTIVNLYEGDKARVCHIDAYRLTCGDDLFEVGFEDYLNEGDVIFVEWADIVRDALPKSTVWVSIKRRDDVSPESREITIEAEEDKGIADIGN